MFNQKNLSTKRLSLTSIALLIVSVFLIFGARIIVSQLSLMAVLSAPELFAYVPAFCVAGYVFMAAGIAGFLYIALRSRFQVDTQQIKVQSRKLKFSIVALTCLMMCTSFLMTAPIVSANTVATTGYYLATPIPIADWYIGNYSTGNVFAINGSSWANLMTYPTPAPWASVTGNYTAVWENVLAATSYGTIYAKEVAFPLSLHTTIPNNTQVICNYQGVTYKYINSASSLGSPYTISVGQGPNAGYYLAQDSGDRICFTSTNYENAAQNALNNTPSGGKVVFNGNFVKYDSSPLLIASNISVSVQGSIKLASTATNGIIFQNLNSATGDSNIHISGGTLDLNHVNGAILVNFVNVTSSSVKARMVNPILIGESYFVKETRCTGVTVLNTEYPNAMTQNLPVTTQPNLAESPLVHKLADGESTDTSYTWTLTRGEWDASTSYIGNMSAKLNPGSGGQKHAYIGFNANPYLDLTRSTLHFMIKFDPATMAHIEYAQLIAYNPNEVGYSAPMSFNATYFSSGAASISFYDWQMLSFPISYVPDKALHNITYVQLRFYADATDADATVWVDGAWISHNTEALLTVSFDDSFLSWIDTALPIFDKYNAQGTIYYWGETSGGWGVPYATLSDMETLAKKGWDICSHPTFMTKSGTTTITTTGYSYAATEKALLELKEIVSNIPNNKGARFTATGSGYVSDTTLEIQQKYVALSRPVFGQSEPGSFPIFNPYLYQAGVLYGETVTAKALSTLAARGGWLNLFIHDADISTTAADLEALLEIATTYGIKIVTVSQAYDLYLSKAATYDTTMQTDIFTDVLAANTTYIHAGITGTGALQTVTTGFTNPDIPRSLTITTTNIASPSGKVVILGVNSKGTITNATVTISAGATVATIDCFTQIISVTIPSTITAADTISIGIGNSVGLSNKLYSYSDIISVTKNGEALTNANYSTIRDGVTLSLTDGDDITVRYTTLA
jgi:hypothetical protein